MTPVKAILQMQIHIFALLRTIVCVYVYVCICMVVRVLTCMELIVNMHCMYALVGMHTTVQL